jgi:hypothetical protein
MQGIFVKAAELLAFVEGFSSVKEPKWIMRGYKTAVCGWVSGLNTLQKWFTVKAIVESFFFNNLRCGILIISLFIVTVRGSKAVNRRHHDSANGGT